MIEELLDILAIFLAVFAGFRLGRYTEKQVWMDNAECFTCELRTKTTCFSDKVHYYKVTRLRTEENE